MQEEAIYHINEAPYAYALSTREWKVRLRAAKGDVKQAYVLHGDRYENPGAEIPLPMALAYSSKQFDYYEAAIPTKTKRLRYQFLLEGDDGETVWYGENGSGAERDDTGFFQCPYLSESMVHRLPEWVADAVVYQVFPERFRNGDPSNDPAGALDWDSDSLPAPDSSWGGDLQGIIDSLGYLEGLGVNTLYLTPVFHSPSNHKYDTTDYYTVDPVFGDEETLRLLVEQAHEKGIRVVLDAVFNHTGDDFFAFQDVLKQGSRSPYKGWFHTEEYPVVQQPVPNYETFGTGIPTMPKLNLDHPDAQRYMLDVTEYWMERLKHDGWRLDVANEVPPAFWRAFRKTVKDKNPDALIIGEVMHHAGPWLRGDQFDGVMNYPLRDVMLDYFARQSISPSAFMSRIVEQHVRYTELVAEGMWNLLDSHDTERFLTSCTKGGKGWTPGHGAEERMKLAVLFQLTFTGIPVIYYGDEAGMEGETDPDCRRPMLWDPDKRNSGMDKYYRQLLALRRLHPVLGGKGGFRPWLADDARHVLGYIRGWGQEHVAVLIHNSAACSGIKVELPEPFRNRKLRDLLTDMEWPAGDSLELPLHPFGAYLLKV